VHPAARGSSQRERARERERRSDKRGEREREKTLDLVVPAASEPAQKRLSAGEESEFLFPPASSSVSIGQEAQARIATLRTDPLSFSFPRRLGLEDGG